MLVRSTSLTPSRISVLRVGYGCTWMGPMVWRRCVHRLVVSVLRNFREDLARPRQQDRNRATQGELAEGKAPEDEVLGRLQLRV